MEPLWRDALVEIRSSTFGVGEREMRLREYEGRIFLTLRFRDVLENAA